LWTGLALSVVAFISYFVVFARFPFTRDIPWATFLLFAAAIALLIAGIRGATRRKALAWIGAAIGAGVFLFFCTFIVLGRQLPSSQHAPAVGQKAPPFTLADTSGAPVSLASLVASAPRGVLLVFYRGYW